MEHLSLDVNFEGVWLVMTASDRPYSQYLQFGVFRKHVVRQTANLVAFQGPATEDHIHTETHTHTQTHTHTTRM